MSLNHLCWFFDHAETVSDTNLERIKALEGGIAVQHRMAFQGEYFIQRYGKEAAKRSPPLRKMLDLGIPLGGGTDATRVASYNPWISLYWLITGRTIGGTPLYGEDNTLQRIEALSLLTLGSAKLSGEAHVKGSLSLGKYADLAVLSLDYLTVHESSIKDITAHLTLVGGKIVYGSEEFTSLDPNRNLPVSPNWSPVAAYEGPILPLSNLHPKSLHTPLNPWSFGCDCFSY
jgi:predicted amidohydrolase YtcJ